MIIVENEQKRKGILREGMFSSSLSHNARKIFGDLLPACHVHPKIIQLDDPVRRQQLQLSQRADLFDVVQAQFGHVRACFVCIFQRIFMRDMLLAHPAGEVYHDGQRAAI